MAGQSWPAAGLAAVTNSRSATRELSAIRKRPAKPAGGGALAFPRESRILRTADFRAVYDHGTRIATPLFAAFCLARPEPGPTPRLGLTVPRAVGKAVARNRIKRRMREVFRLHRAEIHPRWDIVLNPRRAALDAEWPEIERAFAKVIQKCGNF
jgi:ribonuclease P protein component